VSDEKAWDDLVSITATRREWQGIVNSIYQAKQEYATNEAEGLAFDAEAALIEDVLGADP
jgi:hypothetical protein